MLVCVATHLKTLTICKLLKGKCVINESGIKIKNYPTEPLSGSVNVLVHQDIAFHAFCKIIYYAAFWTKFVND
ncbi:MAG: hypothetical protein B6I20_13115 [Bacteroidetes bacterium 4572_117]|nr:MAG: hypothetical protein B6I20_13115 [Bacteroidetes bacterium 4572_117]